MAQTVACENSRPEWTHYWVRTAGVTAWQAENLSKSDPRDGASCIPAAASHIGTRVHAGSTNPKRANKPIAFAAETWPSSRATRAIGQTDTIARRRRCSLQGTISYGSVVITVRYQVEWDIHPEMKLNG